MATQPTSSAPSAGAPPKSRRLTAEARKSSILAAARRAFAETGDMNGTTVRAIAEQGEISEGVIYRHFDSKEQLFFEAVVEPVSEAVDKLVAATAVVDRDEPLTPERQMESLKKLYRQLITTLDEVLPLLGLVMFGDPKVAQRFYRENLAEAMDRLANAWSAVEARYGVQSPASDITARAVMGMALMLALEGHHNSGFDRERALDVVTDGTVHGFFSMLEPSQRR